MANRPSNIRTDVTLSEFTTIRLGGSAKYFAAPKTDDELREALQWAKGESLPVTILGGGSNVIIPDQGIEGLVIHPADGTLTLQDGIIVAGAGVPLGQLIAFALEHDRGGLSWLIGVPGQVGGSVAGNAGSRHDWIGQYVVSIEAMSPAGKIERFGPDACAFAYRSSIFHTNGYIIVRVGLQLPTVEPKTEQSLLREMAKKKQRSQPIGAACAGCMFRNVSPAEVSEAAKSLADADGVVPVWRLVTEVGLVGYHLGGMTISDLHANFMINTGTGTADQAVQLMSLVKQRVRDTLGIQLHNEIRLLGF